MTNSIGPGTDIGLPARPINAKYQVKDNKKNSDKNYKLYFKKI